MTPAAVISAAAPWCVVTGDNADVLPTLPDGCVAHVITDPPYSQHVHGKQRRGSSLPDAKGGAYRSRATGAVCANRKTELGFDSITDAEVDAFALQAARLASRWSLVFCDLESVGRWMSANAAAQLGHVRVGLWVRGNATPQFTGDRPAAAAEAIVIAHPKGRKRWNGGGSHAVWTHTVVRPFLTGEERVHTTQKPLPLMLELVSLFTEPGELVLDPFCGSGTTGVACVRLGRRFIGIERDAAYADVARERIAAEAQGLSLRDARAGQLPMWPGIEP